MHVTQRLLILALLLTLPLTGWGSCVAPRTKDESESLSEHKPVIKPQKKPVFIEADRITGYYKQEVEATGNAVLRQGDNTLSADRMKYYEQTEDAEVEGNVRLERPKDILKGKKTRTECRNRSRSINRAALFNEKGKRPRRRRYLVS